MKRTAIILGLCWLAACGGGDDMDGSGGTAGGGTGGPQDSCPGRDDGGLEVTLSGGIEAAIVWSDADVECGGVYIDSQSQAKLSFSGLLDDGSEVGFIIDVEDAAEGETGNGFPSEVSIVGNDQVWDSQDMSCTVDVIAWRIDEFGLSFIDGVVRCDAPLLPTPFEGPTPITISEITFRGAAA